MTIETIRTLDITALNDAEMELLLALATDPAGDHPLDGCRDDKVAEIFEFRGLPFPRA